MRSSEPGFETAVSQDPGDDLAWQVWADYLEEVSRAEQAELMRLSLALRRPGETELRPERETRLRQLLARRVRPALPTRRVKLNRDMTLTFSLIPPGTFLMGTPVSEVPRSPFEFRAREVKIAKGFWMSVTTLTRAEWEALLGGRSDWFRNMELPISLSWHDCQAVCGRLTDRAGRRCRLPTEEEWEYACRAGTSTPYYTGRGENSLKAAGWYSGNSRERTHRVAQKAPNAFGLSDMHGNTWEWCADALSSGRAIRGGSAWDSPELCRAAYRAWYNPASSAPTLGCRVVLCLD